MVSVASIKYRDSEDVLQTLPTAQYIVVTAFEPGIVYLKAEYEWPCLADRPDAVEIEFVAGYGAATADTPGVIYQALLLLARHFFSGGSPNIASSDDGKAAEALLLGQRVKGFAA